MYKFGCTKGPDVAEHMQGLPQANWPPHCRTSDQDRESDPREHTVLV